MMTSMIFISIWRSVSTPARLHAPMTGSKQAVIDTPKMAVYE